ncbi:MAG: TRAPP complex subunit Trs31 [Amphiamblys sp. WSBS2006]|nr:MAG: TRAPP complex subunit Trs31 [Amphiamblys sp. WSBS2006]
MADTRYVVPERLYEKSLLASEYPSASESVFVLLLGSAIRQIQKQTASVKETENVLGQLGRDVGTRLFALSALRDGEKRANETVACLQKIGSSYWKTLFGKKIDSIEISEDGDYMLIDNEALCSKFHVDPKASFTPSTFSAGMLQAMVWPQKAKVTAHSTPTETFPFRTVFLIKMPVD